MTHVTGYGGGYHFLLIQFCLYTTWGLITVESWVELSRIVTIWFERRGKGKAMAPNSSSTAVLPHALLLPGVNKLTGKRVILASGSPRRQEILRIFVCPMGPLEKALVLISSLVDHAGSRSRSRTLLLSRESQSCRFRKHSRIPRRHRDAQSCRSIRATRRAFSTSSTVTSRTQYFYPFIFFIFSVRTPRMDPTS
jgi:hypothetical protein